MLFRSKDAPDDQAPLSLSPLSDEVDRVVEARASLGQLSAPPPSRFQGVAQAQTGRLLNDEPGLVLQRVTMAPGAGLKTLEGLSTHVADQDVWHDAPAFPGQVP